MKAKIGKYPSRFSTYELADLLCFWAPKKLDKYGIPEKPDWVENFGEWLTYGSVEPDPEPGSDPQPLWKDRNTTWLYNLLEWIDSRRDTQRVSVRIDPWDTYSMDHTLAHIILPMLQELKANKQGAPFVDAEDVPAHLRPKKQTKKQQEQGELDSTHFERWDWVLDEMIFAFQSKVDDSWEDQFITGEADYQSVVATWDSEGKPATYEFVKGPDHTMEIDTDGYQAYQARAQRGFELFGKYYSALWS